MNAFLQKAFTKNVFRLKLKSWLAKVGHEVQRGVLQEDEELAQVVAPNMVSWTLDPKVKPADYTTQKYGTCQPLGASWNKNFSCNQLGH